MISLKIFLKHDQPELSLGDMRGHLHPENNDENSKSLTTLTVDYDYELDNNDNER